MPSDPATDTDDKIKMRAYMGEYFAKNDVNGYIRILRAAGLAGFLSLILFFFLL